METTGTSDSIVRWAKPCIFYSNLFFLYNARDVKIYCGNNTKAIYAHKVVLMANSGYFRRIIEETSASETLVFGFSDFAPESFRSVMFFMYFGEVHLKAGAKSEFIRIAERLELQNFDETISFEFQRRASVFDLQAEASVTRYFDPFAKINAGIITVNASTQTPWRSFTSFRNKKEQRPSFLPTSQTYSIPARKMGFRPPEAKPAVPSAPRAGKNTSSKKKGSDLDHTPGSGSPLGKPQASGHSKGTSTSNKGIQTRGLKTPTKKPPKKETTL